MNYLKELNAFYDWLELNSMSVSAIVLWHALMHINNKCGWAPEFTVAISVLETKTGLKRRTIERARNELTQKQRITWKSRKGNQSAAYSIVRLFDTQYDVQQERVGKYDAHRVVQVDAQHVVQPVAQCDAINKQNKKKQNDNQEEQKKPNPHSFFEANGFGTLSPIVAEDISHWLDNGYFDESEIVVIEAMKQAVVNNARSWKYVTRILVDWSNRKLKTLQDVQAYQAQWQAGKSNVATFKPRTKGNGRNDTNQSDDRPDYSTYDFGF